MSEPLTFNEDELKKFIRENLTINVDIDWGERVRVELQFIGDDSPFASDSFWIPPQRRSYE